MSELDLNGFFDQLKKEKDLKETLIFVEQLKEEERKKEMKWWELYKKNKNISK
jgi:hypothetical protein